jgi:hypothetical protein
LVEPPSILPHSLNAGHCRWVTRRFLRETAVVGFVDLYARSVRLRVVVPAAAALVAVGAYTWNWHDQIGELRDHYESGYAVGAPLLDDPTASAEGQRECWRLALDRYGMETLRDDGNDEPLMFWNGCLDAVMGGEPDTSSTHLEAILED